MEGGNGESGTPGNQPRAWTAEEDALLKRLVDEHGPEKNWPVIGAAIANHEEVSCRLRWFKRLCPGAENIPFTAEDDAIIVEEYAEHPNDWAAIARRLPGRTDEAIKNHWNWELRHRHENPVDVFPPGIRNDSAGASSVPSGAGSLAPELGHRHENPVNVIPPGIRNSSSGPSDSGSVRPRSWAPERDCGLHTVLRLLFGATGRDPDAEDGGGEAAEVERTRRRDCILGIFLVGTFILGMLFVFLASELNHFLDHVF